jgi:hypothetical protein
MKKADIEIFQDLAIKGTAAVLLTKFLIIPFWKKQTKTQKEEERKENAKKYTIKIIDKKTGRRYTINLETQAQLIYDAFYSNFFVEDEEKAIDAIKVIPSKGTNYIFDLATIYQNKFDKDLKADFIKYLTNTQWKSIAFKFDRF